jgi:transposase InsO family protein
MFGDIGNSLLVEHIDYKLEVDMPWREVTILSQKQEFVHLSLKPNANISQLCSRFGISRKTVYKYIDRFQKEGAEGLDARSRRPKSSPNQTAHDIEQEIVSLRKDHEAWGGRKIKRRLENLGHTGLPSPSTITQILRRNYLLDESECEKRGPFESFEREAPNELWQMDFKGPFATDTGLCHPLTVLDDNSRFNVALRACANETTQTVKTVLIETFDRYGLPEWMLMDNGPPWGAGRGHQYTALTVWLIRLGVNVTHGRPYHPQTQGKDERFNRTLKAEVLRYRWFTDICECQWEFDRWRHVYNFERPHEAIEMATPATRYEMSGRAYPSELPPIEYGPGDIVRKVQDGGRICFRGQDYRVGTAFIGHPVALRPTVVDGVYNVFFCHQEVAHIDISKPNNGDAKV